MRKGEAKRQEMLAAAEKLFLTRGYEATSVQDILEMLNASKGGFYHYFASKEEVLKLLCAQRAERAAEHTAGLLENAQGDMARINAVLYGYVPLNREEAAFLRMLLPVMARPEGRIMAMIYQDALLEYFQPLLAEELAAATESETIAPPVKGLEEAVLHLVNSCWMKVVTETVQTVRDGGSMDSTSVLNTLERYRRAIEVLLDAPYGSVEILRFEELGAALEAVR